MTDDARLCEYCKSRNDVVDFEIIDLKIEEQKSKHHYPGGFIIIKYKDLYLAGYLSYYEDGRIEFDVNILNFDFVFKKTRIKNFRVKEKNSIIPMKVEVSFDLKNVYEEMIHDCEVNECKRGDVNEELVEMFSETKRLV